MLESAVGGRMDSGVASAERGVAVFDRKGELSRADGLRVRSGGLLDVRSIGPHEQAGDVDFQVWTGPKTRLGIRVVGHNTERWDVFLAQFGGFRPRWSKATRRIQRRSCN